MDPKDLIKEHLAKTNLMQLATSVGDQPWACTVHYYSDENFNLYWMSTPDRNHSQQIEQNPNTAVAIMVHEDSPRRNT